jgi:hypothetical protein
MQEFMWIMACFLSFFHGLFSSAWLFDDTDTEAYYDFFLPLSGEESQDFYMQPFEPELTTSAPESFGSDDLAWNNVYGEALLDASDPSFNSLWETYTPSDQNLFTFHSDPLAPDTNFVALEPGPSYSVDPNPSTNPDGIPTYGTGIAPTIDDIFCHNPRAKLICCRDAMIRAHVFGDETVVVEEGPGIPANCISVEDLGCSIEAFPVSCCEDLVRIGQDPHGVGDVLAYKLKKCGKIFAPSWKLDLQMEEFEQVRNQFDYWESTLEVGHS